MPATYEPIATTTLGADAPNIIFSSIPGTYTDLRLVLSNLTGTVVSPNILVEFGPSAGATTSFHRLSTNGSTVASDQASNSSAVLGIRGTSDTRPLFAFLDIFSYSSTSLHKLSIGQCAEDYATDGGSVSQTVGMWKSLSAITSLTIFPGGGNLKTGTTATIYGIKAA